MTTETCPQTDDRALFSIDLPYDRAAIRALLATEMDSDERRLAMHEVLRRFDFAREAENITRIVDGVRARREELVFGRMSRAFHNQGLLFANAGYVQIDNALCAQVAELTAGCLDAPRLSPPADRLHILVQGAREAPLTALLGALERFEDAILEDMQQSIGTVLKAEREGHLMTEFAPSGSLGSADARLQRCHAFRAALLEATRRPAAFVLMSQRLSATGSHLMARINEAQEPYLGKAENLKVLARQGGHRMYASPDYRWLHHADHWIEAIPLFIKERVLVVDGHEVTETVIDQASMEESFREELADHWAINIESVMDSEHVALAREILARSDVRMAGDDLARAAAVAAHGLAEVVGALAANIAEAYRTHAEAVHLRAERVGLSRYEALRACLDELTLDHAQEAGMSADAVRLEAVAHLPRRPLPALHVLTTQSARMSDGYIRTWLEESMAIYNVIRAHGLEGEVKAKMAGYRTTIGEYGARLVRELGMWAEVEEVMALENLSEDRAVARIVAGNRTIARQVSVLAVLAEYAEAAALTERLQSEQAAELQQAALRGVYERNEMELLPLVDAYRQGHGTDEATALGALIADNPEYADDLAAFVRFAAREAAVRVLGLEAQVRDWLRNHTRLALTTARREVLLAHGLNHLTLHPRFYYRATGGNKRFHMLYTPSRVDLGSRERESVETWAQWVGGADREAARVGRRIYGLINKNVKMFDSLTEPEVLKTGENASMVAHFSYANAMSLLVNAVGRGDVEELGDQMSLRKDRFIHPGGEGYGGYCVPKDGLFLEFVLILTRATKLRQLGVADHLHASVVRLAHYLLARQADFATDIEWEAWAMQTLASRSEVAPFFALREGENGPVPVFQITRIARALTQLGRPELTDAFDVLANLAARWGIHKIIVGGEQVNRFMPFYKAWLTYRAVEDARRLNPGVQIDPNDMTLVLSAEYKPDTQDGRFSVGMRKYEIFANTSEHLTYSLDVPGQDLVHLMFQGFDDLWANRTDPRLRARLTRLLQEMQVREDDGDGVDRLRALFPGYRRPAEMRMVSPMGLATSDLLHYTSDTNLEGLAQQAQNLLLHLGLTETEIAANMHVYGPRLERWTKLRDMSDDQLQALHTRLGGAIHALALSIIGPAGNYEMALQGADVLDTGIPHTDLQALLANPVKVRDLMLEGNPHSALVLIDGASGARHRALNRLAVMRWFAAGEAIGRNTIYRCVGVGADSIESWREEMRQQLARARALYQALASGDAQAAREQYADLLDDLRASQESSLFLEGEERMLRFNKLTAQERITARALAALAAGQPLESLDFAAWLALGGQFWLMGAPATEVAKVRQSFEAAITALGGTPAADEAAVAALLCPAYVPAVEEFREEKGIESSNKATEERAAVAMDTRKRLAERAARAKALHEREAAFAETLRTANVTGSDALVAAARTARGDGQGITQAQYGQLQAYTRLAFLALSEAIFAEDTDKLALLREHVEALFTGRTLDALAIRAIGGGYEDAGDIARLAQRIADDYKAGSIDTSERDRRLEQVADVAELFDCCKAIELIIGLAETQAPALQVWRALADFFAESLNDHRYEYRPWAYSRGIGFAHLQGDALYQMAVAHYSWLYTYLRGVALVHTELRELDVQALAHLLGDMAGTESPIGAGGDSPVERQWRVYNQLRELAFIRNDGFPLPEVFPAFDPTLIQADSRTNLLLMYPLGRTHVSRALMEGPTLARELAADARPGMNLLIARDARVAEGVLQVDDAHLYISREEYLAALVQIGLSHPEAENKAKSVAGPKGVRVAVRFTRPVTIAVAFPFHGHPKYDSGLLEELGLPYSCQCLFHTWTTYDKAKYPEIFAPQTGVDIPGEIDWLAAWTAELGEAQAKQALEHGDATRGFSGLRTFAQRYRLMMVKDAAESGGRGQKAFTLRGSDGAIDEAAMADAVDFTYQISLKHNVALQEVIISSPEYWGTEAFLQSFVDRQVQEWGAVVNRTRRPRTALYGSHRLIFSSPEPRSGEWHVSHPITLNSRQLITNVGRGGTLEYFQPEHIQPEFREQLWTRMREAGEKCMQALAQYGDIAAGQYRQETGREIGADATGLSYAVPRYMMLDFLVQPIFAEEGTLVDLEPVYDVDGNRTDARFILQQGEARFDGHVKDWRVVLIEPNIGIGLWDRVAIRETVLGTDPGANARIVLRDLAKAGEDYLGKVLGG